MTNPIAVSQQRRRILARQICAWARSTSLSAKDAEDFACAAIDAFEAEIRADAAQFAQDRKEEWERAIANGLKRVDVTKQYAVGAMTEAELLAFNIRNQKDHDHE